MYWAQVLSLQKIDFHLRIIYDQVIIFMLLLCQSWISGTLYMFQQLNVSIIHSCQLCLAETEMVFVLKI